MIIQYDTRPDATIDEKLRSLIESIQLAFGEVGIRDDKNITSQNTENAAMQAQIRDIDNEVQSYSDAITGIDGRVETLEDTTVPGIEGRVTTLEDTTVPALDSRLDAIEETDLPALDGRLETLEDTTIPALAGRVTTLEGRTELPAAPAVDGAYKLTVTVTSGVPVYTWESA